MRGADATRYEVDPPIATAREPKELPRARACLHSAAMEAHRLKGQSFAMTRRLLRLCLFLALLLAPWHAAAVELRPGQGVPDLAAHLRYASDPGADLATMLNRFRTGQFGPDLDIHMLDSNYAPEAWAATELINASIADGRAPDPFAITLDIPVVSEVDLYLIREDGLTENLLTYSIFSAFDPAQHAATRLRTPIFEIAPQERVILLAHIKFGPFQSLQMALETPSELEGSTFSSGIALAAFYAFSVACLVFFVGFFLALRDWTSLFYALLYFFGLGLVAVTDGLLFRFLYPNRPDLQSAVGFFILFALSGSGFLLAGHGFGQNGAGRMARSVRALALLSALGFLASLASPGTYAAMAAYVLLGLMVVLALASGGAWRQRQGATHALSLWLAVATVLAILAVLVLTVTGWGGNAVQPALAIKLVYATLLIATITSFAAQFIMIRRQHAQAVAEKVAALEQEAKRSQELLEAEQNYSRARDLAQLRQRQLATASHDFRQPLASLRMTLDGLGDQVDPELRKRLGEAFDYMEELTGDYLSETAPDAPPPSHSGGEDEPYALSLILQTVHQMFHDEAVSRGLRLDMVESSATVTVPPIVLMRIVSNLVSNAVKYTRQGRVLIGVRRRATGPELWVCDTGPGMTAEQIETFRQEGQKGAQSEGHGLGLAVCFGLAQEHGLHLRVHSVPGRGTVFCLAAPPAA